MPIFDYKCPQCGNQFEATLTIKNRKKKQNCPNCGTIAIKQLTIKPGGTLTSHPAWLDDSVRAQVQDTDISAPITTRDQLNKHLKDTGLVAL